MTIMFSLLYQNEINISTSNRAHIKWPMHNVEHRPLSSY